MTNPVDDDGSVTVHVPKPRPVTDPLQLKAIVMREYREKARLAGRTVSEQALERFAVQELNLVDAFGRWSRPQVKKEPDPARKERGRARTKKRAAEQGLRVVERPGSYDVHSALDVKGAIDSQMQAAIARIGRILENDGGTHVSDFDKAIAATAVPKLAREFLRLLFGYQLRGRQSKHNPFCGLSDRDASRKFLRGILDICDRSTGVMGHWWTK